MTRMVIQSKIGGDGVLRLDVPVGVAAAEQVVQVTIEPVKKPLTQEEWRQWVLSTAGSVPDPTFMRHPQGEYEERDEL